MKRSKIYFIGRKQGFGKRRWRLSHLENRRCKESEGLKEASHRIVQTRFISLSDSIVRPEFTTDAEVVFISRRLDPYRKTKTIINDISCFYKYDSKDRTFDIWKKEKISVLNLQSFNNINNIQISTTTTATSTATTTLLPSSYLINC